MVKRQKYEDTKFHFVTTTNPYAPASKDVQTFIRRQAMKDAGMERRKRNKQKKEERSAQPVPNPTQWAIEQIHRPIHGIGPPAVIFDANSRNAVSLPLLSYPAHSSNVIMYPSPSYAIPDSYWEDEHCYGSPRRFFHLTHPLNRFDDFASLPIPMDQDCRRIFKFALCTLEKGKLPNIRGWWMEAALEFPTMFRQKLAISAQLSAIRSGPNGKGDSDLSSRLTDMAIRETIVKLGDPIERISNANLSTIIALTYGVLHNRFVIGGWWIHLGYADDWEPHLLNAYEIVKERGGIEMIDSQSLRQEMYWLDLIAAAHQDTQPRYPLPLIPRTALERTLSRARQEYPSYSGLRTHSTLVHLRPILERLDDMNCIIAARRNKCRAIGMEPWQDGEFTTDWLNPTTHGLLMVPFEMPPSRDPRHPLAFEAMRLATLLYTFAVRALPGNNPRPPTPQDRKLKDLLRFNDAAIWAEAPDLGLWVLAVLSLSFTDDAEKLWLSAYIKGYAASLAIYSIEELLPRLKVIAWEREFSRVSLDLVWSESREVIDVTDQSPPIPYIETFTPVPRSPSVPDRFYAVVGRG